MASLVRFLTPEQLADRYGGQDDGPTVATLADWRRKKIGPPYIRSQSKGRSATILYPEAEVEAWEKRQLVATADT
jgi:hypothetical protein